MTWLAKGGAVVPHLIALKHIPGSQLHWNASACTHTRTRTRTHAHTYPCTCAAHAVDRRLCVVLRACACYHTLAWLMWASSSLWRVRAWSSFGFGMRRGTWRRSRALSCCKAGSAGQVYLPQIRCVSHGRDEYAARHAELAGSLKAMFFS